MLRAIQLGGGENRHTDLVTLTLSLPRMGWHEATAGAETEPRAQASHVNGNQEAMGLVAELARAEN